MSYDGVGHYEHYKGEHYTVRGLARHTETGEMFVLYDSRNMLATDPVHARPLAHFNEPVDTESGRVERFERDTRLLPALHDE